MALLLRTPSRAKFVGPELQQPDDITAPQPTFLGRDNGDPTSGGPPSTASINSHQSTTELFHRSYYIKRENFHAEIKAEGGLFIEKPLLIL